MENNIITKAIKDSEVSESTSQQLLQAFQPFLATVLEWADKAKAIVVTDATQVSKMKQAREGRLILKKIRTEADKTRKALKEESLKYGKAVQSAYNAIESVIEPIETHLEKQEKFAELQEMKRQEELRNERQTIIDEYQVFLPQFGDLGKMSDEEFAKLLNIAKIQKEQQEKEAREKAQIEEENRRIFEIENAKLKAQREAERQKNLELEAKLNEERKARAKIEAEQQRQAMENARKLREAEQERLLKEEEAKKAEAAPDFEKLKSFAEEIASFELPEMKTERGKLLKFRAENGLKDLAQYIMAEVS